MDEFDLYTMDEAVKHKVFRAIYNGAKLGDDYCRKLIIYLYKTYFKKETREGEITEMFAHRLEQTIRKEPAYWLWSHKRWKMTREEADRLEEKELNKKKE